MANENLNIEYMQELLKQMEDIKGRAEDMVIQAETEAARSRVEFDGNLDALVSSVVDSRLAEHKDATELHDWIQSEHQKAVAFYQKAVAEIRAEVEKVQAISLTRPALEESGQSITDETGKAYVYLSNSLSNASYLAFLQAEGEGTVYVQEKSTAFFIVAGTPNTAFAWTVKAKS